MGLFSIEAPSLGSTNDPPWPLPPGSGPASECGGVGVRGNCSLAPPGGGCRSVMELQPHLEILRSVLVLHAFTQNPQDCPALVDFYDVPMEAGR